MQIYLNSMMKEAIMDVAASCLMMETKFVKVNVVFNPKKVFHTYVINTVFIT